MTLGVFAFFTLIFVLPDAVPTGTNLSKSLADHKITLPKYADKLNPFKPASHKPPEQKTSNYDGSSWYSNWDWRNPFSSSTTMDESRSILPPLKERTPIYCYYDPTTEERDAATKEAESALLLTWRRAWWAQGFKPIILSAAEARNNPLYHDIQSAEMEPTLKKDMLRWLAWDNMGGGLLTDYLFFPLGPHQDPLLSFLRSGEYPTLTRWENLGGGLFAGPRAQIAKLLTEAFQNRRKKSAKDIITAVSSESFQVDPSDGGVAYYGRKTVGRVYPSIAEGTSIGRAQSLQSLNLLINAHLQNTWHELFGKGIAVLKPLPTHTTTLVEPALQLAKRLASCLDSPIPKSCPPNRPKCAPCVSSKPMKIFTPVQYWNKTDIYTIGTVPHPYMLRALEAFRNDIDVAHIRRQTARDQWLYLIFQELLGTSISASARVVTFKDIVAAEYGRSHSLWLTGEQDDPPQDADWWFGFSVPRNVTGNGEKDKMDELTGERELLTRAREVCGSELKNDVQIRQAVEAWNLADTEAWRFAKAFMAQSRTERREWESTESKYAGGAGHNINNE